ncbi:MAG TPA: hypothetical protein VK178_00100 [Opitutaceae bacterium]|nr:hypothetical protein [Opitutaceae bacterium]
MNSRRLRLSSPATLRLGPVQRLLAFCLGESPRLSPPSRRRTPGRIGRSLPKE